MSPLPYDLSVLEDEARLERMAVLVDWVGWMVEHYGLERLVPPCWWRHPAMVEELNALELAWSAAYGADEPDKEAPLRWHEDFQKTRDRIAEWDRQGCAASGHRDRTQRAATREDPAATACAAVAGGGRRLGAALRASEDGHAAFADELFGGRVTSSESISSDVVNRSPDPGADVPDGEPGC